MVILSTMLFSGISGSPSANTAAIGSVALPAMRQRQYPPAFATAVFASAGGVSTLVPPAIDLIIIGVVSGMSIGALFAAGITPAIVLGLALMGLTWIKALDLNLPLEAKASWPQRLRVIRNGILPLFMIVIILGGIYGGIFTPTEASAVAVVYGALVSFFVYRELKLEDIPKVLLQTVSLSGVVLFVLGTASMFSFVLTFERLPHLLAEGISTHAPNWIVFILFVHLIFLVLGMVMDALPPIIILMPILLPAALALGMDPIQLRHPGRGQRRHRHDLAAGRHLSLRGLRHLEDTDREGDAQAASLPGAAAHHAARGHLRARGHTVAAGRARL